MGSGMRCATLALGLGATMGAPAADRLFPTDTVRSGEVDLLLDASWSETETPLGSSANFVSKGAVQQLQLQFGLDSDLHIGASVPYYTSQRMYFELDDGERSPTFRQKDEARAADFWITGRLLKDPDFSLAAEYRFHSNTAGGESEFKSDALELRAGSRVGRTARVYARIGATVPRDSDYENVYHAALGAFSQVSRTVRLVPELFYARSETPADDEGGFPEEDVRRTIFGASFAAHVTAGRNFMVIPHVGYREIDDSDKDENSRVRTAGLSVYALFGHKPPKRRAPKAEVAVPAVPAPEVAPAPAPAPMPATPARAPGESYTFTTAMAALARPDPNAQTMGTFEAGTSAILKARVTNPTGAWWYIEGATVRGWIREADLP